MSVGSRIKHLRDSLGLSLNAFSKDAYIGILEQCFQNYLNTFCKNIF